MTDSSEIIAAICLSVAAVLLCIGIIVFLIFLCVKAYQNHSRLNKLEEKIENIQQKLQTCRNDTYSIDDESITLRRKADNDSAIDIRDISNPNSTGSQQNMESLGPRLTINIEKEIYNVIKKETTNVFGLANPRDSQVLAIAQDYYREKTKSEKLVGIEDMDITDHKQKIKGTVSRREVGIPEERPTSVLLNPESSQSENKLTEKGVFVHKLITTAGGELHTFGVKLKIPEGALPKNTKITLGITWDTSFFPRLSKSQSLLSPVVVCQPSVKFLKPVKLTFPHCAVNPSEDWKLTLLSRENNLHNTECEWIKFIRSVATGYEISKNYVTVQINHFTLYTLSGESVKGEKAVKAVKLLAFTSTFEMDKMFTVRIYCINNYDEDSTEMKNILKSSVKLEEKQADVPQPLFIVDNEEDLSVSLTHIMRGWINDGDYLQNIDFESIWHGLSPSCKFVFHPPVSSVRKIACEFTYYQKPSEKKRLLKIADEYKEKAPLALKKNLEGERKKIQSLILKLDPRSDSDYRLLAERIGYTFEKIKWLEDQKSVKSPTELLIETWISEGNQLEGLKEHLVEMGRLDAADVFSDKRSLRE